jgi:hypothetical protein
VSEQVQLALVGVLASFVTTLAVGIANWLKTQQVHKIVNSRLTHVLKMFDLQRRMLAAPPGPVRDQLESQLDKMLQEGGGI